MDVHPIRIDNNRFLPTPICTTYLINSNGDRKHRWSNDQSCRYTTNNRWIVRFFHARETQRFCSLQLLQHQPDMNPSQAYYKYIYVWAPLIKSSLQFLRTCHRIHKVVHVCKKLCTFHRSCARFTEVVHVSHAPLIPFVFNCCGMDGSHWGLLTRLSRYIYIYIQYIYNYIYTL